MLGNTKNLSFLCRIIYWGVNFVLSTVITEQIFNWLTVNKSLLGICAIVLTGLFLVADIALPKTIKALQIFLSLLLVSSYMTKAPEVRIYMVLFGLIKAYAVVLVFIKLYPQSTLTKEIQGSSGKDFYNSQAWRKLRFAILEQQGRKCYSCGESRIKDKNGKFISYHVDHIRPRSLFPQYALDPKNLTVACANCNLGRSNLYSNDYRKDRAIA